MLEAKVSSPQRVKFRRASLIAVPGAIALAGFIAQCATYLNHDVGWVLYSSNRMFDGAVFGRDIVAANPPLIWWISLIPDGIARALHLPLIGTFRAFVLLIVACSLIASDHILAAGQVSTKRRLLFLAAGAYLLTFGIDRDFGQREQIAVALVLPYVLAVASRMRGTQVSVPAGVWIGATAGIGVAFKPYFLLVPLLLEGALLLRRRSPALLIRPEVIAAVGMLAIYAAALLMFARPWLFEAAPQIARTYWAFDQPTPFLLIRVAMQLAVPFMALGLVLLCNWSEESVALALAGVGFLAAAIVQAKYYTYHVFPGSAFILLALAIGIPSMPRKWRAAAVILCALAFLLDAYDSTGGLLLRSGGGREGREVAVMSAFVDEHVSPGRSFLAMSTHPFPGFPTALYAHRDWASASNSDLFLPAVVRLREGRAAPNPELLRFAESKAHESMRRDLAKRPQLVLIDVGPYRHAIGDSKFDFLRFYLEDPVFRAEWRHYRQLSSSPDGYVAYMLDGR